MLSVRLCLLASLAICLASVPTTTDACVPAAVIVNNVKDKFSKNQNMKQKDPKEGRQFKGCYEDSPTTRDMGKVQLSDFVMTLAKCQDACKSKGTKFLGLQNSTDCYCSESYGSFGEISLTKCNTLCQGSQDSCGGEFANAVYEVK